MSTDAAAYCSDLVRESDEDRWLAAQYASPDDRRRLMALYAFHIELKRTPSQVSEAPLGEIRFQWRRDALTEIREGKAPRAHPVIEEAAACGIADVALQDLIDPAIDANVRPLYGLSFKDVDDLASWLTNAESYVDVAAARLLGGGDETAIERLGSAFAMAREGKGLAPELADDIRNHLDGDLGAARPYRPDSKVTPALAHLSLTRSYLARERPFPLLKRMLIFRAIASGRL